MKVALMTETTHNPFNETHRVSCLRENLTSSSDGEGLETGCALSSVPRQSFTRPVSSEGHILQSVEVRPRLKDSGLVAWEAPWRESKTAEPSNNVLEIEYWQSTRLQRAVNAGVASLYLTRSEIELF